MYSSYGTKSLPVFTGFDEVWSSGETTVFCRALAIKMCHGIQCETTRLELLTLVTGGNYRGLCDFETPYSRLTPSDASVVRQILALYQKREDLDMGYDRKAEAVRKFKGAEARCRETNECFRAWEGGRFQFDPRVEAVLHRAQRKISDVLGDVPELEELKFRFGPGATTLRKKSHAHPRYKLGDAWACSESMVPIAGEFLAEFPTWVDNDPDAKTVLYVDADLNIVLQTTSLDVEIHHGKAALVPKNGKEYRVVVVEPPMNTLFQLGVGDEMAKRMRKSIKGLDIKDQVPNQELARLGSLTGLTATLDLSSASDMLSKGLVAHLLPPDWYTFLSFGRTPVIELDGELIRLEKFSSMGNGFTFPLETLIFWALASSCCETHEEDTLTRAYGDDIIVPAWRAPLLIEVLRAVGFQLNPKKSFYFGAFRESCGKDYLSGIDIRPWYLDGPISCKDLFGLHNFAVERGDSSLARFVKKFISKPVRLYGPAGYGDGHLVVLDATNVVRPYKRELGWGGYVFDTYVDRTRTTVHASRGDYVLPSYSVYANNPLDEDVGAYRVKTPRDRFVETAKRWAKSAELRGSPPVTYEKGRLRVTLPGTSGYKRISIYTFNA